VVLQRDDQKCIFCDSRLSLETAHIFSVSKSNKMGSRLDDYIFKNFEIMSVYDTSNGLTLCKSCHGVFDAHHCYLEPINENGEEIFILHFADAIKRSTIPSLIHFRGLEGKRIKFNSMSKYHPTKKLIEHTKTKFDQAYKGRLNNRFKCTCK
jgi:hypothetical protein